MTEMTAAAAVEVAGFRLNYNFVLWWPSANLCLSSGGADQL